MTDGILHAHNQAPQGQEGEFEIRNVKTRGVREKKWKEWKKEQTDEKGDSQC